MTTYIDFHIIQTVPPSLINRDDNGSAKTAMYGGVRRHRVSSQSWKRAARLAFNGDLPKAEAGIRTKRVIDLVAQRIIEKRADLAEMADGKAQAVLEAGGVKFDQPKKGEEGRNPDSKFLWFLSNVQIDSLADIAINSADQNVKPDKKSAKNALKQLNSYDLALFGRMVADDKDLNVDASCQVAHAISTHAAAREYDYFTAVDDVKSADASSDAGAGMIGTVEFTSSTLYRYATINLQALETSLGDVDSAKRAVAAFAKAFITSMPTGKQNTFANGTLPEAVYIAVRNDQPVSLVQAFEKPITANETSGYSSRSIEALAKYEHELEKVYSKPKAAFTMAIGDKGEEFAALGESVALADLEERIIAVLSA
ncbi:type I-E CRISPR-associated protein Cas7/Cse4/CasC [Arcanobacterium hippocoleae]|uniref:CRISPR system Cascade subunit CasC n=1 Tax=Arcanobacterium hippocoleae TaxID=149017 RepID=A0ABU1T1V8_9ACTO|nr:type I-E CRISPR-associated protein Cas7/Cse4/CasC [Arcanobacterium hippocoleae]MDR6939333.1 CRISPR system Cascade subunit CasC [Arcanobacterium hippocoleae]